MPKKSPRVSAVGEAPAGCRKGGRRRSLARRDRKAIGWVLRTYADTDPRAVRAFVEAHKTQRSSLSVREALKQL